MPEDEEAGSGICAQFQRQDILRACRDQGQQVFAGGSDRGVVVCDGEESGGGLPLLRGKPGEESGNPVLGIAAARPRGAFRAGEKG